MQLPVEKRNRISFAFLSLFCFAVFYLCLRAENPTQANAPEVTSGKVKKKKAGKKKVKKEKFAAPKDVKAPEGFEVSLFAVPPEVNYPVCLTAAPTGELFVGVDPQGSLGKEPGKGKILRCIDSDGDGKADKINEFCKADHPRGLIYDNGKLWVLHPPSLTLFHDDDGDGVADRSEVLIKNVSTEYVTKRGADHTTNGIRMGIDGWIYIALGDFGLIDAEGTDGTKITHRGGGVLRVRPDGTEMELYATGLRNILDVCVDPYMNIFTRDNTNDGEGWDVRVSHIIQTANYGYPSLFTNFTDEIMPPLGQYGGGSGCGAMFLHDLRWPKNYGNTAYTCDWGRHEVYLHNFPANGATFDPHQESFLKIPRPTDIDVDGSGRMYVSSWKNGKFKYDGPDVGFVARVVPKDFVAKPFPDLSKLESSELIENLNSQSAVHRFHSQRELLRLEKSESLKMSLLEAIQDHSQPLYGRVASIYTLKQKFAAESHSLFMRLIKDDSILEFLLRAMTDRKSELKNVNIHLYEDCLTRKNPRIQAQALIGLGRLGEKGSVNKILQLTKRKFNPPKATKEKPVHAFPDPEKVLSHLATKAIVSIGHAGECLSALRYRNSDGALKALQSMHSDEAVDILIKIFNQSENPNLKKGIITTLIRLYHKEGEYESGWWGTRPDIDGPYYSRVKWSGSEAIETELKRLVSTVDEKMVGHIKAEVARHFVKIDGIKVESLESDKPAIVKVVVPKFDPNDKNQIGNLKFDNILERALAVSGNAEEGEKLFKSQSCIACHSTTKGQKAIGPYLADIGKRSKINELYESILKPSKKIAQGFDTYLFVTVDGKVVTGFVVREAADTIELRKSDGKPVSLAREYIHQRVRQKLSSMPEGLVNNLTPEQLADLIAYLQSLH